MFFLRRLRYFNAGTRLLGIFYQSVVASFILFAVVFWEVGMELGSVKVVTEKRMRGKLKAIQTIPFILSLPS